MNHSHTINQETSFNVVGISIRTTNKAAVEQGTITKLWQQFFMDQCYSKIENKIDGSIIALYYDFETDPHAKFLEDSQGQYTILIGAQVSACDTIADGFICKQVAPEKRMVFTSEIGSTQHIVFDLWKKIWAQQNQLHRTFGVDYEIYDERSHNPENAQMEIHIGIK